jgi:hypothetical protein
MDAVGEEEVNEIDTSKDAGDIPTRFGINSFSQLATSCVPSAEALRGRHGLSSMSHTDLPDPSSASSIFPPSRSGRGDGPAGQVAGLGAAVIAGLGMAAGAGLSISILQRLHWYS